MKRHTYSTLAIARRHPQMFSKLVAPFRLAYWPTASDGTHIVAVHPTGLVRQVGVLWGAS